MKNVLITSCAELLKRELKIIPRFDRCQKGSMTVLVNNYAPKCMALYHCQNSSLSLYIINDNATFKLTIQHPFGHNSAFKFSISHVNTPFAIRHLTMQDFSTFKFDNPTLEHHKSNIQTYSASL